MPSVCAVGTMSRSASFSASAANWRTAAAMSNPRYPPRREPAGERRGDAVGNAVEQAGPLDLLLGVCGRRCEGGKRELRH